MPVFTPRSLHRKFIAFVAGLSIAITGFSAVPAAADQDDTARALAAILGIAIVGAAIHDARKDKEQVTRHDSYRPAQRRDSYRPAPRRDDRHHARPGYGHVQPRPLPPRADNRKLLPQACLQTFQTRRGQVNGFGEQCLSRNYSFTNRLPQDCALRVRTRHGHGRGYEARCLRQYGYKLARR
jgi:hypothetical protein